MSLPQTPWPLSRREFLAVLGAGAAGVALAGCSDDEGADTTTTTGKPTTSLPVPELAGPPFTLGVASGDPLPDSVILWTRLAPEPLTGGGMPEEDVPVMWEVATDESFSDIVQSGSTTASPALAHSVHVDANALEPDTWYWYRFRVGEHESPVGRTRTAPADGAEVESLTLAVTNCQDYGSGRYAAYKHLAAADDLDLVLFLGDYIYEFAGTDDPVAAAEQHVHLGEPLDLESYRTRFAQYRTDPDLAAAHARAPWVLMWDDHEVANNYATDIPDGPTETEPGFDDRRLAAYQAFWEHQPIRIERPENVAPELWQAFSWGALARTAVIDQRSQSDPVPCRSTSIGDTGPICDEAMAEDRTNLGEAQEAWLFDELAAADATWTVLGSPTLLAGLNLAPLGETPRHFLELWDGYPAARTRVIEALGATSNPIVLSGDFHASFVCDVRADPAQPDLPAVATEFCAPAISSVPFDVEITDANPHIKYFEARHGYLFCTVTPTEWTAEFRYVADVQDPASAVETVATFVVREGAVTAEQV